MGLTPFHTPPQERGLLADSGRVEKEVFVMTGNLWSRAMLFQTLLVWGSCGQAFFSNLESIHVRAAKIIFNLDWCTPSKDVLAAAKWNTLETMYEKRLLILAHQAYYYLLPCPMNCLFVKYVSSYDFRRKMTFKLPRPRLI